MDSGCLELISFFARRRVPRKGLGLQDGGFERGLLDRVQELRRLPLVTISRIPISAEKGQMLILHLFMYNMLPKN
jgi:hypothetical protein